MKIQKRSESNVLSKFMAFQFTGFNINVFDEGKFLLPIFTMGKFFERDGKRLLPLAIQVHHAVCDGYHVGVFVEKLQNYVKEFVV